jgi:two-component system sensor histidine kinase/response regulator
MPPDFSQGFHRILAVDDSPDNLFLIETILDDPSYQMTCVASGQEALDTVATSPPDVILLDVMMPGLDGYAVTERIRQDTSLPYIPILLITAHDQSSLVQGLDAGADDFIRKPVDVNELKARVRSLLRLKRSIDAQTYMIRQRDDFVARLTHDLRTPLVAANRMLKLCQDDAFGPIPDDAKYAASHIIDSNNHLLNMVNTLLEVYRHEAGHKSLTVSPVNLFELTEAVVQEQAPTATEKQLTCLIRQMVPPGALADQNGGLFEIEGDYLELRRVITNLVGNAIKFTDAGGITVTVGAGDLPEEIQAQVPPTKADHWIWVEVIDTGIGISPEDQGKIFEWFRQGNQARAGHGLGLHLARRIAQIHGGTITVSSAIDQGSCFTLYLPAAASA